jgi:hypothetical protein
VPELNESDSQSKHTNNKAMELTDLLTRPSWIVENQEQNMPTAAHTRAIL